MKAFITGAGGFIGSHLVEALLDKAWDVKALVRYNSRSHWGWLESMRGDRNDKVEVISGDITDQQLIRNAIADREVVFHLAALIGIPYSYAAPGSYIQTNVIGTLNLAQAALDAGVGRFIHTSTSEVYGTACYTPIDEKHPLQAQSPYSASKIGADKIVESFFCSFDLPAVVVRPFNTYGPRQSARAIVPTIISQALAGSDLHLGSIEPVRDLTYVTDTVAGFIAAAEAEHVDGEVINLGSGSGAGIAELVAIISEIIGRELNIIRDQNRVRPAKSEVMELVSSNSKALGLLGWQPDISIRDGLKDTVSWIKEHGELYSEQGYTV